MKNKFLYLFLFIFLLPFTSLASHIVGGSLTYEQRTGSSYLITLTLYRDCTNPKNEDFPTSTIVNITTNNGTSFMVLNITKTSFSSVPSQIDTCVANPGICLQAAVYSKIVTGLVPGNGGYHIYSRLCCRNDVIQNILTPEASGETFYTHIPENNVVMWNSSPKWTSGPQSFICAQKNISIDHSAVDADGDSLYYSLYTPYDSNVVSFPGGVFTAGTLKWKSTYGPKNPLDPATPNSLKIDANGVITGNPPPMTGNFVLGIRCEEYRNGLKLGEILRDFQLIVVVCPPLAEAGFSYKGNCEGTKISFTGFASNTIPYFWNFGNTSTLGDTSHVKNPVYTYPGLGKYTVMQIVNKGTPCADTSIEQVQITSLNAAFTSNAPACQKAPVNFTDISTIDSSNTITGWSWNFGDGSNSLLKNPMHPFTNSGNFIVTLIISASGCKDTISNPISIQAMPVAKAGNDTTRCANNPSLTLKGTILNAGGGMWKGSGTFLPNNNSLNPSYTPSTTAIKNGADTLLLISTNNVWCPADTDEVILHFSSPPTANAGKDVTVCKDTSAIPVCATITVANGVIWRSTGNGQFGSDSTQLCTSYKPSMADTAKGSVILFVTTTGNGNCNAIRDSLLITFTSTIKVNITSTDSSCVNNPIPIAVNVTTNSGIWTSTTGGIFKPTAFALTGYYLPSKMDSVNGSVKLIFSSTNNGNCLLKRDTLLVTILPAPTASFNSTSACAGNPVQFRDTSLPLDQIDKWNWNFGDVSAISTLKDPSHVYINGGKYAVNLIILSKNGCADTIQKQVAINYNPAANFNSNGICIKAGIQFNDSSFVTADNIISWKWLFGDGATDTLKNPFHYYSSAGTYTVLLIVNSSNKCIDSVEKKLTINKGPTANFIVDKTIANVKQIIHFTDQSIQSGASWFWNFGDGAPDSTSTLQNPIHSYREPGHYQVCLIASDKNGCLDTVCRTEIISLPIGVPNAFSPNNDGQNDSFKIYGGPFKQLNLKVYSNWGQLIFESDKQAEGWDGTYKGMEQPAGVYIYTIYCVSEDGKEHKLSGDLTLLR